MLILNRVKKPGEAPYLSLDKTSEEDLPRNMCKMFMGLKKKNGEVIEENC